MSGTTSPAPAAPAQPHARRIGLGAKIAIVVILVLAALYLYLPGFFSVKTDDAYVTAHVVTVSPKVPAYVLALGIDDNSSVTAGELLLKLDPRDYQNAVNQAEADLQSAAASHANVQAQLAEQKTKITQAQASLSSDQAALLFAQQELQRYGILVRQNAAPEQHLQQVQSDATQRQADLRRDQAALAQAQAEYAVLQAQLGLAQAGITHQQAALAQAQLNLSYTSIAAVTSGTIANKTVETGDYVQAGQMLFSIVPNETYIIANYKETQVTDMHPGQKVDISIDGFPGLRLRGHVQSLQRGTGSVFALLPPENATGNFVKIVQRVPVKITFDDPSHLPGDLAPGMSAETAVHIRSLSGWLSWL
jgi:membrane fusion protein (multidrug efflux system)